jgi:hypothetical protein
LKNKHKNLKIIIEHKIAISIKMNESNEIIMILNGCHHKNTCLSNGCCQFEYFTSNMDIYKPNAIARMYLHLVMNREYKINDILKQYEEYFSDGKNINENGIEYLKKLILEDHEKDKSWKRCSKCYELYENKKIKFEDIIYILPNIDYCIDHK